jgi:hypothetical protein
MSNVHIFGIRHHGPGSARSLRLALEALRPDVVLVEGPPDAEGALPLLAHPELRPPVALLVYAADEPRRAAFYPLARFSPELQAVRYGLAHGVPVRWMDLPQWHQLALDQAAEDAGPAAGEHGEAAPERDAGELAAEFWPPSPAQDPLGALAAAAGFSDGERWWEQLVEQRRDGAGVFEAVLEAMAALREGEAAPPSPREALREAWMRRTIRAARRDGFGRIAVVCGAWHGPALAGPGDAKADEAALKGLPRLKTVATVAPWTYGRLSSRSGYGAGVGAPGWYDHLWEQGEAGAGAGEITVRWMARVARLLRAEDLDASSAHVIEAVRLAEALAALRGVPLPGLPELDEACRAVFCFGRDGPMALIHERLVVGERIGAVPDDAPAVPLQQDLRREQRRLRLPAEASWRDLELDLRRPNDRERSALLRRLNLIGVPWGRLGERSGTGTFRELWRLQWEPEFDIALVEAAVWGTTVAGAAAARALERAERAEVLDELVGVVSQALLADLPDAVGPLMARLEACAATGGDAGDLMDALTLEDPQTRSSLVASLRYGSVREIDVASVGHVIDGLVARICVGLPYACGGLDDEAAEAMVRRIVATDAAIRTLERPGHQEAWVEAVARAGELRGCHGLVAGRCCRILLDAGVVSAEEVGLRLGRALSPGTEPAAAAAWLDGLLRGSGALLVHDEALWGVVDRWVAGLGREAFQGALPLLRRTFAGFALGERRALGERAAQGGRGPAGPRLAGEIDLARAERALALVAKIYGVER